MKPTYSYYHPFNYSYLGVFVKGGESTQNQLLGFRLNDINLYHQPVLEPQHAVMLFLVRSSLVMFGGCIQAKLYFRIKQNEGLLKENAQLYVANHLILWPTWLILVTATDFIHPPDRILGNWFCMLGSFMFYLCGLIMAFHSLVAALMRYLFIVHEAKVKSIGISRMKKIFMALSFLIPLIVALWTSLDAPEINAMNFINKCYGNGHKSFLIETSSLNVLKSNFCAFENYSESQVIPTLRRLSCIGRTITTLFIGFNFVEAFLYYKMISHLKREHKETMEKLRDLLTRSSKIMRNKRHLINIHVTILAWLVEFLGFLIVFLGHYVIGHNKKFIVQVLELVCYCIILPYVYLINDTKSKMIIAESRWYLWILQLFNCKFNEVQLR